MQKKSTSTSSKKHSEKEQHREEEKLSEKINIMKGVRQNDTLSPVSFTAAVKKIFKRMNIKAGININGIRLSNLRFADDITLFSLTEEKLRNLLEDLNEQGKKDRMN